MFAMVNMLGRSETPRRRPPAWRGRRRSGLSIRRRGPKCSSRSLMPLLPSGSAERGEGCHPGTDALAFTDEDGGARRQEHIHARAELHYAEAGAGTDQVARFYPAHDPPGQDAHHLPDDDCCALMVEGDLSVLVQITRFSPIGGQEPTRMIRHIDH